MGLKRASAGAVSLALILTAVLAGPAAFDGSAAAAGCSHQIVWRTHRNGTQVCPRFHSFVAGTSWVKLRWSGWGNTVAVAHGFNYDYPPPAGWNGMSPLALRLSMPRRCPDGARIYERETGIVDYRNHVPGRRLFRFSYRIYCSGATTSGGGG